LRIRHGYTRDSTTLGRLNDQESVNRRIKNAFNCDESNTYLADIESREVSMSSGLQEELKKVRHREER
jgi:hypothetical protein